MAQAVNRSTKMACTSDLTLDCLFSDNDSDFDSDLYFNPDDEVPSSVTRFVDEAMGQCAMTAPPNKKRQLKKPERKCLISAVRQIDIGKFLIDIIEKLNKQLHFTEFEECGRFLQTLGASKGESTTFV